MISKDKPYSFEFRAKNAIIDRLLGSEFHHNRTRWYRLFKLLDREKQYDLVSIIIDHQFKFVAKSINEKVNPIVLEGLGKFEIKPGKRDFVDLCKTGEYESFKDVKAEVKRRQKERIEAQRNKSNNSLIITKINGKAKKVIL